MSLAPVDGCGPTQRLNVRLEASNRGPGVPRTVAQLVDVAGRPGCSTTPGDSPGLKRTLAVGDFSFEAYG